MKVLSEIENNILLEKGIVIDEWLGRGATSDVFSIKEYRNQSNLCIKYMWDARKKDVETEYKRYRHLYETEPKRFAKVVDLIWVDIPDEDEPQKKHPCAIIVMEKLQKVRKTNNSIQTIVKILYDVTVCLGFMHILSIYHRDIKLDNIMYCQRTGTYILIDYGISAAANGTFTEHSCKGTLNNIAPESLKGQYSNKSEFYSLGMTAREWLVGHELTIPSITELAGESLFDRLYEEKAKLMPLKENVFTCPQLVRVINKLTQFDRADRYQNYRSLLKALKSLVANLHINLSKANVPNSVYLFAVNSNQKNNTEDSIRKSVNRYLSHSPMTNSVVQVFPFSTSIHTRMCSTHSSSEIDIMLDNENCDFINTLLQRIKHFTDDTISAHQPEIHVCIVGAKSASGFIQNSVKRIKEALNHTDSLPVGYRVVFADSIAVDVCDYGISEITVVNNSAQLQKCCELWFKSVKEEL